MTEDEAETQEVILMPIERKTKEAPNQTLQRLQSTTLFRLTLPLENWMAAKPQLALTSVSFPPRRQSYTVGLYKGVCNI